jgi:hypothetical protein
MKKAIAIFFLAIFSFSFTEARQFLKLPRLIEHYYDHMSRGKITLAAFLQQHYLADHKDDGDKNEDRNLPFKSTEITSTCFTLFLPSAVELTKYQEQEVPEGIFPWLDTFKFYILYNCHENHLNAGEFPIFFTKPVL